MKPYGYKKSWHDEMAEDRKAPKRSPSNRSFKRSERFAAKKKIAKAIKEVKED